MNFTRLIYCIALAAIVVVPGCRGKDAASGVEDTPVLLQEDTPATKPVAGDFNLEEDRPVDEPVAHKKVIVPEELPIRKVGELVLQDSIEVYDNEVISFMLLDSLLSPRRSSRDLYFKVFNKLMDRSGGNMGDAIGDYALTYVQSHPGEFLTNSKNFSEDRLASWASIIGIELYLTATDSKQAYENSTKHFTANCKQCDTADLARLQIFNQLIWKTIEQNLQERKP